MTMRHLQTALKSLWADGTKWAELFGALGILAWGCMHLVIPAKPGPHTFGVGMGWITREHLEWALLIAGTLQVGAAIFGNRLLRIVTAWPSMFLTLDVVADVLLKGEYPPGAIAIFATTCLMNLVSMIRNGERLRAGQGRNYA